MNGVTDGILVANPDFLFRLQSQHMWKIATAVLRERYVAIGGFVGSSSGDVHHYIGQCVGWASNRGLCRWWGVVLLCTVRFLGHVQRLCLRQNAIVFNMSGHNALWRIGGGRCGSMDTPARPGNKQREADY